MNKWFMLPSLAAVIVLTACETKDAPLPKDEPNAERWATAVKTSYPDWQPPLNTPASNPEYKAPVVISSTPESSDEKTVIYIDDGTESEVVKKETETAQNDNEPVLTPPVAAKLPHEDLVDYANTEEYTVAAGDSLSGIAKKKYRNGNLWPVILEANKGSIPDKNKIRAGMKIQIPKLKTPLAAPVEKKPALKTLKVIDAVEIKEEKLISADGKVIEETETVIEEKIVKPNTSTDLLNDIPDTAGSELPESPQD